MKKFTFSFKSLLLAAGLLLGSANAWAEDVYTTVYTRATVGAWAEADKTDWGGNSNLTIDANYGLFFNPTKPGAAYSASKSFSIKKNSKVKYEVSWRVGSATGRDSNYEYIQFGDHIRISWNSNYWFYLDKTGTSTMTQQIGSKGSNTIYTKPITIIFDTSTKKVESFSFDGIDLSGYVTEAFDESFNSLTFGFQRGGSTSNWGYPNGIITVTVSECEQAVTNVGYTINYKLGENLVKSVASEGVVGQEITADIAVDGTETGYENHYLITAGSAPSMTLVAEAASNVLNVPVRAPYTATLKVTTTVGENAPVLVETPLVETDAKVHTWSYAYPMYVLNGGKYYKADNTTTFGEGGEFTNGQVIEKSVTYSTADESVVFFKEAEAAAGTNYSYSNGGVGNVASQNARDRGISVGTLDAGVYSFTANITAANRRSLGIRQSTNDFLAYVGTSNEDMSTGVKSANFVLAAETSSLYINGANSGDAKTNQSEDFDYVLIKKVDSEIVLTSSANLQGYKTFYSAVSNYQVDANTTIYKGSATPGTVTLTSVEGNIVPKNTPVVLKTTNTADYTMTLTATTTEATAGAFDGNALQVAAGTESNVYILAYTTADGFGFYNFTGILDAGDVYLAIPSSVKMFNVVVNGETVTGVEAPVAAEAEEEEILYNTAGQQVTKDYKGVVINQKGEKRFQK